MRNLLCILCFTILSVSVAAQKVSFIYLQADNNSPFYVKMGDKIYSSSSAGYLILPNLVDSTYMLVVGFPSVQTESRFNIPITNKDRGFIIKNLQQGLTLFDLQTLSLINEYKDQLSDVTYQKRNDNFASVLSKAAHDTTLLYAVIKKEEPTLKQESVVEKTRQSTEDATTKTDETKLATGIVLKDTVASITPQTLENNEVKVQDTEAVVQNKPAETIKPLEKEKAILESSSSNMIRPVDTMVKQTDEVRHLNFKKEDTLAAIRTTEVNETFRRSIIIKHSESSTSEGFGLIYYDKFNDQIDTIRLIIPNPKFILKPVEDTSASVPLLKKEEAKASDSKKDNPVQQSDIANALSSTNVKLNCQVERLHLTDHPILSVSGVHCWYQLPRQNFRSGNLLQPISS